MPPIRRATPADIDSLITIRNAVHENRLSDLTSVTRADYDRFVAQGRVWVCEDDGGIVGFSASDERDGTIWALFVDAGHHGRGIGTALLARACDDLRWEGFAEVSLTTDPGTAAERLYRKLGWTDLGLGPDGERRFLHTL